MANKYKCLNSFTVDSYDENEQAIENEFFVVEVGTVWELQEDSYLSDVRLVDSEGRWLELAQSHLEEDFIKVD